MPPEIVEATLQERGAKYGDSWLTPNRALEAMTGGDLTKLEGLVESGHFANWFLILGKLCRAVYSPELLDHWIDISGYATLSANAIIEKSAEEIPF